MKDYMNFKVPQYWGTKLARGGERPYGAVQAHSDIVECITGQKPQNPTSEALLLHSSTTMEQEKIITQAVEILHRGVASWVLYQDYDTPPWSIPGLAIVLDRWIKEEGKCAAAFFNRWDDGAEKLRTIFG